MGLIRDFFDYLKYSGDREVQDLRRRFKGMVLAEVIKTKINRHRVFWVGRSDYNNHPLRIGIEFSGQRKYFMDWEDFQNDARCSSYKLMPEEDADLLEAAIKHEREEAKKSKKR